MFPALICPRISHFLDGCMSMVLPFSPGNLAPLHYFAHTIFVLLSTLIRCATVSKPFLVTGMASFSFALYWLTAINAKPYFLTRYHRLSITSLTSFASAIAWKLLATINTKSFRYLNGFHIAVPTAFLVPFYGLAAVNALLGDPCLQMASPTNLRAIVHRFATLWTRDHLRSTCFHRHIVPQCLNTV